ncbi:MAG: hypothetical protein O3A14_17310 [Cyanobacteria bacterium]|nr:hypothetical protein [Cyanobacteriota bacterium]
MSEANIPSQRRHSGYPEASQVLSGDATETLPGDLTPAEWQTVNFPGSLPVETIPVDAKANPTREVELLNLIRDLNRCNEVLLGRVNQLEESLETAQQALQAEVEHHHSQSNANDPATVAQQRSMAQLLSEPEGSNDALKRQRILAETLQAQLDSGQERVTQLERECTLLQQQHTAKSQSLQKAEETCRDLRSRLQRQQRYTLQFKVALEKCLDMSTPQQAPHISNTAPLGRATPLPHSPPDISVPAHQPVSMPRADRIQPWSSIEADPFPDPQLAALLRARTAQNNTAQNNVASSPTPDVDPTNAADVQLWQDLERVVEQAPTAPLASPVEPMPASEPTAQVTSQVGFTEPMPWGPPQPKAIEQPEQSLVSDVEATPPEPAALAETFQPAPAMPEVTTWLPSKASTTAPATIDMQPHSPKPVTPDIPLLKMPMTQGASPSPIVHPLRPQKKKLKSLSAVDLPSFPRAPQNVKAN